MTQEKSEYDIQAEQFLSKHGIRINKRLLYNKPPDWDKNNWGHNRYSITVSRKGEPGHKFKFTFWDSIHNTAQGLKPTDYDILTTLNSDSYEYEDFKDFCSELGYSNDSISALHTWKRYQKQSRKINRFFTEAELNELREIS